VPPHEGDEGPQGGGHLAAARVVEEESGTAPELSSKLTKLATYATYFATIGGMLRDPIPPSHNRSPLGIPWGQWVRWAFFIAAITVIVTIVVVGASTKKPWFWALLGS
jgi:hypothetical protein